MGGVSLWQLGILLAIVILVFGTKKLKNLGGDLGGALKGFKSAMADDEKDADADADVDLDNSSQISESSEGETIDVTPEKVEEKA